jgi:hypothetical protein
VRRQVAEGPAADCDQGLIRQRDRESRPQCRLLLVFLGAVTRPEVATRASAIAPRRSHRPVGSARG